VSDQRAQVVVTVGTDHHRFDRLIGWVDAWAADHREVTVLVQHGTASAPKHARAVVMLGYDDLVASMAGADLVVAQGGPATIMDARSVGHRPVVVPRRAHLDEVVDDHQVTFATWMAEREMIWLADDEATLRQLIDDGLAAPTRVRIPPDGGAAAETLDNFRAVVQPLLDQRAGARARRRRFRAG
jgi:UDP-N-acetylglucosamine transferase subunit ALG13